MAVTPRSLRIRAGLVFAGCALGVGALAGCAASSPSAAGGSGPFQVSSSPNTTGFDGSVLRNPVTLSAQSAGARFSTSAGTTTTLGALGAKGLMLLYFGYTHCPDVCPTTMADLAQALQNSSGPVQARTQVVFVTSDPARDTPAVMKQWLGNVAPGQSSSFIGLTASTTQIDRVATSVGVPLSPPVVAKDGTVTVEHGAQVLAFMNGKASLVWLAGTTPDQYTHDIAALLTGGAPA